MITSRAALLSLTALALTMGIAGTALADDAANNSTTANQSAVNQNAVGPSITDHLVLKYIGVLYGPPVGNPLSPMQHNNHGAETDPLQMEDVIYTGYRFNKKVSLMVVNDIVHTPINGQSFKVNDPQLRISHASIYSLGQFNLAGSFGISAPLSDNSVKNAVLPGMVSYQVATLDIGSSRWSIFSLFKENAYFYTGAPKGSSDFALYNFTQVNYQWKPNLGLWFGGEVQATHAPLTSLDTLGIPSGAADVQVGVSWDISKKVNLSPFFVMYPQDGITLDSTSIGAMLTANIF